MDPLKVGLMGLGRGGRLVADALLASSWCELVAVASPKSHRVARFAEAHPGITAYDDFRSLIVENVLDALFVAVAPFHRMSYLRLAAERGLPVWMLPPAARRFDEALEIVRLFREAGCPIVVSRAWGIEPALQPTGAGLEQAGETFLARGHVMTCWAEDFDWRGDADRAGGGVLLDRGYGLIDAIVQVMGLPTAVFTAASGASRPDARFRYDTEDTGILVCQYADGGLATVSACWTAGPEAWTLDLHGTRGSVHVDADRVVVLDRTGTRTLVDHERGGNPLLAPIEEFLSSLRVHPGRLVAELATHLPTMAVLHAAYLSARTAERERPAAIFRMHDLDPPRSRSSGA